MNIQVFGNAAHGFSASSECTTADIARLRECPFCGGRDMDIVNTHTPCYWVECNDCETQKHDVDGSGNPLPDEASARAAHEASVERVIAAWNTRTVASTTGVIDKGEELSERGVGIVAGMCLAVGEQYRLVRDATSAADVLRGAGIDVALAERCGVADCDLDVIRAAFGR